MDLRRNFFSNMTCGVYHIFFFLVSDNNNNFVFCFHCTSVAYSMQICKRCCPPENTNIKNFNEVISIDKQRMFYLLVTPTVTD